MLKKSKLLKLPIVIICLIALLGISACKPGTNTSPQPTTTPGETDAPIQKVNGEYVQQLSQYDFTNYWWSKGWTGARRHVYIMSGNYGLAFDTVKSMLYSFGAFSQKQTEVDAMQQNNKLIEDLPKVDMSYGLKIAGEEIPYAGVEFASGNVNAMRLLESGRYLQRIDAMYLRFGNDKDLYGRVELACFTDYISISLEVFKQEKSLKDVQLSYTLRFDRSFNQTEYSLDNRALTIKNEKGEGYTIVVPADSGTQITVQDSNVTLTSASMDIRRDRFEGFGAAIIPSTNASPEDAKRFAARDSVTATAIQISPTEGREQKVTYEAPLGMVSIDLSRMYTRQEGEHTDDTLNTYDRLKFTLTNNSDKTVKIPIQFIKKSPLSVTGMAPMIRDASTGEPTGLPVQIVRNWHYYSTDPSAVVNEYAPENSPKRYWEGRWFHGYIMVTIPAHESVTYEYACAFGQWGTVYSASHSQLCLVGWGFNLQQWETSAIGSFGESFCYDIARSYTPCVMGDICPLAIYSRINNQKYNWTTNIGGVDFLDYYNADRKRVEYAAVKTYFKKTGPNITEVIYSGITTDDAIKFDITVQMPRTNDISRVVHRLKYTFLKDTSFSRLAFYQFGADNYNYKYWTRMVVGNDEGPVSFELDGQQLSGEFPVMGYNGELNYIGRNGMNQIEIPGEGLWMGFLGAQTGKSLGNKAISVREYKATLNGKEYSKPTISLRSTRIYGTTDFGSGFELNPPKEVGKIIKAGSVVELVIDYMNFPIAKSEYYGPSAVLKGIPNDYFDTWKLFHLYATQMKTKTTATVGTLLQEAPIKVQATGENSGVVAQFTIEKGISYVPVTISNLPIYNGWELQINKNGNWEKVDQSVHGNDYWQAYYDPMTKSYELTYNVEQNGQNDVQEYRLVKVG